MNKMFVVLAVVEIALSVQYLERELKKQVA
jgi:hypothetical protein